jgi:hypothetical protein
MAKEITPVLEIISPDSTKAGAEAPKIGLVEKSQKAWGWLQQWTNDIKEYVGAHVLSLIRAHYPLLEITRLEAGYPREVRAEQADELWSEEMKHAAVITKDIILCIATNPSTGGTIQLYMGQIPMPYLWLPAKHILLHPRPRRRWQNYQRVHSRRNL